MQAMDQQAEHQAEHQRRAEQATAFVKPTALARQVRQAASALPDAFSELFGQLVKWLTDGAQPDGFLEQFESVFGP